MKQQWARGDGAARGHAPKLLKKTDSKHQGIAGEQTTGSFKEELCVFTKVCQRESSTSFPANNYAHGKQAGRTRRPAQGAEPRLDSDHKWRTVFTNISHYALHLKLI